MLPKTIEHFVQGPCYQMRRFAERSKQPLENMMNSWLSKDNPTAHAERKKKRQTEEEEGRQY